MAKILSGGQAEFCSVSSPASVYIGYLLEVPGSAQGLCVPGTAWGAGCCEEGLTWVGQSTPGKGTEQMLFQRNPAGEGI